MSWTESATATITGFTVQRATNSGFTTGVVTANVSAATRAFAFTGLARGTLYYVRVRAVNGPVSSAWVTASAKTP